MYMKKLHVFDWLKMSTFSCTTQVQNCNMSVNYK